MNKKQITFIAVIVIVAIIASITVYLTSKKEENIDYIIESEMFPKVYFSGDLMGDHFSGRTKISDEDYNFKLNGTFENGIFIEGYISFLYEGIDYYLNGSFNNFELQEGQIIIVTEDKKIEKTGTFKNNKLSGKGSLIIYDLKTEDILFNYAGKFEDDKPIYK